MSRSYLDALSGQPMHPAAQAAIRGFADRGWADPSLPHHEGRLAHQILQAARETVASALGVAPSAVTFHPDSALATLAVGGTAAAAGARSSSTRIITSRVERRAILTAAAQAVGAAHVTEVSVDPRGAIDCAELRNAITDGEGDAGVLVVQAANTELGTLQPLSDVIGAGRDAHMPIVTDATGAVGFADIPSGWSVLVAEAYSWGGPAGVGVMVIADPSAWRSPFAADGGATTAHPKDTADVLAAVGAAAALDAVMREQDEIRPRLHDLIARVRADVPAAVADVDMLGDPDDRLPHIVTFSCLYADGERLASELDRRGLAVGSGSACATAVGLPSHVLAAVGALTHGNVRISLPLTATSEAIDHLLRELPVVVADVRRDAGL